MKVIIRPLLTEKSLEAAKQNVYSFEVAPKTTKPEVAKAVKALYGVTVEDVRTVSVTGHVVRRRTGIGKERDWKKALVTVKKGETIKDFEFEPEKEEKDDKKASEK